MPFDIGFIELCVLMVVSLVLLGPDKLPTAARGISRVYRTLNRTMSSFSREVSRELQMDELKRQMQEQQSQLDGAMAAMNNAKNEQIGERRSGTQKDVQTTEPVK